MKTVRLRHVARINPPTPAFDRLTMEDKLTFLPMEAVWPGKFLELASQRTKAAVVTGYTRFQDGDVLVPKITPTFEAGRAILAHGLVGGVGAGTTELHILRAGNRIDPRFLLYVVSTHSFLKLGEAEMYGVAGQKRVPDDFLRDLPVCLPALTEQRRIADFLDAETARIDRLAAAMASQDDLLKQRRLRILDLVRGEDSKQSNTARLGYFTTLVTSGSRGWGEFASDSGELFFRSANLHPDRIHPKLTNATYVQLPESQAAESRRARIRSGDCLIGITGANAGWVCLADENVADGYVSQHVCLVRPDPHRLNSHWLALLMACPAVQNYLMGSQYGGTKTQLSLPDVRAINIPVIPLRVQVELARSVDKNISLVDRQRTLRRRQISLLGDRRQSLISAAVTGQFDVSTASGRGVDVT